MTYFEGPKDDPNREERLLAQHDAIREVIKDGIYRTLEQIAEEVQNRFPYVRCPLPSVSAQLRHLRKPRFGGHTIDKRHIGNGLYAYKMTK